MKNKIIYVKPEMEIIELEKEDLITASAGTIDYGKDWPGNPNNINNM